MLNPDIVLFATVVEAGSLAAAARILGISAPMASRRLRRLETGLGVTLLHRTTRRLEVTSQGADFYKDVQEILGAAKAAEARLTGAAQVPAGRLKVTAPTSFGRLHITPHLNKFVEQNPKISLTFDLDDAYVDMVGQNIDLGIRISANVAPSLEAERLASSRRVLCAAPSYISRRGAPKDIGELRNHELLAADGQFPWRLATGQEEVTLPGHSIVQTNSSEVVRELAIGGVGIALRSLWDVSPDLATGRLVRILPEVEGSVDVGIFVVRPRTTFVPAAARVFIQFLRELVHPSPPWESQR